MTSQLAVVETHEHTPFEAKCCFFFRWSSAGCLVVYRTELFVCVCLLVMAVVCVFILLLALFHSSGEYSEPKCLFPDVIQLL